MSFETVRNDQIHGLTRFEKTVALVASAGITGFWWLDGWWRGVLGIARGDDWSYLRTAFDFADTGTLTLNGWVHMNFIGQALLALPVIRALGENTVALQGVVGVFSVALLFVTYLLGRQILTARVAIIPVLVVGLSPLFGKLTISFMTDIPSAFFISVSLLLGIQSLRGNRIRWIFVVLSLGAAFVAFSIREFGILAALPTLLVVGYRSFHQSRDVIRVAVCALVLTVLAISLFIWRSGLPNGVSNSQISVDEWSGMAGGAFLVLGFLLSPITLSISFRSWWARTTKFRGLSLVLGFILAGVIALLSGVEFIGDIIMAYGSTWTSVGGGAPTFPLAIDRAIRAISLVSVLVVGTLLATWILNVARPRMTNLHHAVRFSLRNPALAILALFVVILGGGYLAGSLIVGSPLFDRYAIPLLGPVTVLMLAAFARSNLIARSSIRMSQLVALTIYGATAFMYVDTAAQIDGARWAIAQEVVVTEGVAERYIDSGDTWFRYHQTGAGALGPPVVGRPWWTTFFPDSVVCRTITLTTSQSAESYYGEPLLTRTYERLLGEPFTLTVYPGPEACPSQG